MTMPKTGNINLTYLGSKIFVDDSSIKNLNNSKVRDWLDTQSGNVSLANSRNIALHLGKTKTTQNSPKNKAVQGFDCRAENATVNGSRSKVELRSKSGKPCYYLYIENSGYGSSSGGSPQPSASYANVFFKLTDANRSIRVTGNVDRKEKGNPGSLGGNTIKLSVIASASDYITGATDYLTTTNIHSSSDGSTNKTFDVSAAVTLSKPYITISFENRQSSPGGTSGGQPNAPYMGVEIYNVKVELL